jgi:hypothetical protein
MSASGKQTGKARQAFMRSARQAGFFVHGEDRLVRPALVGPGTKPVQEVKSEPDNDKDANKVGGGGGDGTELALDPLLIALLKKVPLPPEKGWPGPARIRWFRTFAMNVSQIYDGEGEPVEMTIELNKEAAG